ncbi:MAG TPA: TetR/AcrR family transcriptional regulator [Oculatellaceae cyanobacterium]
MAIKQDRREEILQAMLELVVERGINDAPMSELSKRSGASAGIIYHYFSSKDDIINQLYCSIKSRMLNSLAIDIAGEMSIKQAFLSVWKNAYNFYRSHPSETKFLSQYENLPCYDQSTKPDAFVEDPNYHLLTKFFKCKKDGGMLKDLPLEVLAELTVGMAGRLAKLAENYPADVLDRIAEICWKSVLDDDLQ